MARPATPRSEWLELLPASFSRARALELGVSDWALQSLRDEGHLELAGRGWYAKTTDASADPDLLTIAARSATATICLRSALSRHGLSDDIPARLDIALPAGTRPPSLAIPIAWHRFAATSFDLGRERLDLGHGLGIGLYSAQRSIIDAFRLRRLEGPELGNEALRRWLAKPGAQPSQLLALASRFPRAETPIRSALEILL